MENYTSTLDLLFNSNHNILAPKKLKSVMKKRLDTDHDIVGGADYIIDRWKDDRLRYGKDKPEVVQKLEMI